MKIKRSSMPLLTILLTNFNSSQALNSTLKILKMLFFPNNSKLFLKALKFWNLKLVLHSLNSRMSKRSLWMHWKRPSRNWVSSLKSKLRKTLFLKMGWNSWEKMLICWQINWKTLDAQMMKLNSNLLKWKQQWANKMRTKKQKSIHWKSKLWSSKMKMIVKERG